MEERRIPLGNPSKPLDSSLTHAYDVSSVLHSLIKERAFRTNFPKFSSFSDEMANGEVSFEQWWYEMQTLRKTYSDSALREGMHRS